MAMYNKFITFLMLTFIVSISFAQQYTPMTAAGYQYKRAKVDSTLHIPSFCGVPNLRNSTAIQGALAMDTCANKLYQWTHAAGWSTISTNAIDSLKRSNDSIFARKSGVWVFQYKDSVGGGTTPSLQDVTDIGNSTTNSISLTKDNSYINIEPSVENSDYYIGQTIIGNNPIGDYSNNVFLYSGLVDAGSIISANTTNKNTNNTVGTFMQSTDNYGWFGFYDNNYNGLKISSNEITNSSGQLPTSTPYARLNFSVAKNNQIVTLPNQSGILTLSVNGQVADSSGSITIPTIDTANKWVNNIYRTSGVDSIYYTIGSTTYAIKDSVGGGSSQNGRFGNDTATIVMAKVHNNSGVQLTNGKIVAFSTSGTSSDAPSVKLANNKADSTSATTFGFVSGTIAINDTGWVILSGKIEKLNTSAFANGDIIYLDSISGQWTKSKPHAPYHLVYLGTVVKANAGNGSIYVKVQNGYELDEIHDVQIISKQNNQIIVYSDTQQLWKNRSIYSVVDTTNKIATKTNLALKLNISDTASMLSPYARTNIVNANLATKVNISDTATMLTPYLRSNTASATYLAKSDSATYYTKYRSDTSRTNIYNALNGKQGTLTLTTTGTSGAATLAGNTLNIPQYSGGTSYTFSTGLTNSANTITNNLSTGVAGGQSIVGGTAASNSLTLSSTSNATKGKILFGTSAYDEVNNRLGIATNSPSDPVHIELPAVGANSYFKIKQTNTSFSTYLGNTFTNHYFWTSNIRYNGTSFVKDDATRGAWRQAQFCQTTDASSILAVSYWNIASNTESLAYQVFGDGNFTIGGTIATNTGYKLDVNGTARVQGALNFNPTNTAAGTTGNQTINKASGTVNIAAAGTTVTVTNNLVTASSIVFAVIRTNDATATIKNVVPASGSFTINLNAATTAEVSIGFFVIN